MPDKTEEVVEDAESAFGLTKDEVVGVVARAIITTITIYAVKVVALQAEKALKARRDKKTIEVES
jgi:hypothetical protein